MIRTIFPLISAVMFLASSADAQAELVGEDSEVFVNAIKNLKKIFKQHLSYLQFLLIKASLPLSTTCLFCILRAWEALQITKEHSIGAGAHRWVAASRHWL